MNAVATHTAMQVPRLYCQCAPRVQTSPRYAADHQIRTRPPLFTNLPTAASLPDRPSRLLPTTIHLASLSHQPGRPQTRMLGSLSVTTSPQHFYPHQAPYQPQHQIPHHRAFVPLPRQPHMHPGPTLFSHLDTLIPTLTASHPTIQLLTTGLPTVQHPSHDTALKINWARDVLMLVDRAQQNASGDAPPVGPATIQDPQLLRLVQIAVPLVVQIASAQHATPIPIFAAEAIYLCVTFSASGAYPDHVPHNPRIAFRDVEQAARAGYAQACFHLGRDYENFNDALHARDCFERGLKLNVELCLRKSFFFASSLLRFSHACVIAYGHT
jgi:hypothetical protein